MYHLQPQHGDLDTRSRKYNQQITSTEADSRTPSSLHVTVGQSVDENLCYIAVNKIKCAVKDKDDAGEKTDSACTYDCGSRLSLHIRYLHESVLFPTNVDHKLKYFILLCFITNVIHISSIPFIIT